MTLGDIAGTILAHVARDLVSGQYAHSSPILLLLRIADVAGVLVTTSDRGGSTDDAMCDLRAALEALEAHFNAK